MKRKAESTKLWAAVILCILFSISSYAQNGSTSLLIQQTPIEGGNLNFQPGVHQMDKNSQVRLIATPAPGYQFIYWIGDVTDPSNSITNLNADGPKVIIAVFQRDKQESLVGQILSQYNGGGGGGQLYRSAADYSRTIYTGGGYADNDYDWPVYNETDDSNGDVPVPDGPDDFPVPDEPIPEPSTILLLISALPLLRRCSK